MADKFETLKAKYQSVLNFIQQQQNTQLQNVNMEGDKLFIRAAAPSQDVKNKIWDQIKLVDPTLLGFDRGHLSAGSRGGSRGGRREHALRLLARTRCRRATTCRKSASIFTAIRIST